MIETTVAGRYEKFKNAMTRTVIESFRVLSVDFSVFSVAWFVDADPTEKHCDQHRKVKYL